MRSVSLSAAFQLLLTTVLCSQIIKRVRESLKSIDELSPTLQAAVRGSYDEAIHVTFCFAVAMAACGLLASIFIKEKSLAQRN